MPNPFVLTFTLRQHTPLIHFQRDQAEASLRPTELKPKLDNFIFQHLLKDKEHDKELPPSVAFKKYVQEHQSAEWATWLVASGHAEHAALDYKLSIEPVAVQHFNIGTSLYKDGQIQWSNQFPTFFANMNQDIPSEEKRFFSYTDQPLRCKLKCLNVKLMAYFRATENGATRLQNLLHDFFMRHNFGMRQSKGFGCFTLETYSERPVTLDIGRYEFVFRLTQNAAGKSRNEVNVYADTAQKRELHSNWYHLFERIDLFYRTLRSGINIPSRHNPFYFKSLLFHWAKNQPTPQQWDKKTIRLYLFGGGNGQRAHAEYDRIHHDDPNGTFNWSPPTNTPSPETKYMYRDLLGLASEQEWGKYGATVKKKVTKGDDELKRFKSPILFKPILSAGEWAVVIWCSEIPAAYLGATVEVTAEGSKGNRANDRDGSISLENPTAFSVADYLRYAIASFNDADRADLVGQGQERHDRMEIISKIYKSLGSK